MGAQVGFEMGVRQALPDSQISGYGNIQLLGVRQAQVDHVTVEIFFSCIATDSRVELFFLGHCRNGAPQIVMARVEQALVRQAKYFLSYAVPQGVNIARLKVGSTCATN